MRIISNVHVGKKIDGAFLNMISTEIRTSLKKAYLLILSRINDLNTYTQHKIAK
jgi:hypothetical protein